MSVERVDLPVPWSVTYDFSLGEDDGPVSRTFTGQFIRVTEIKVTELCDGNVIVQAEGRPIREDGERDRRYSYRAPAHDKELDAEILQKFLAMRNASETKGSE
jgi:hypothetical protein